MNSGEREKRDRIWQFVLEHERFFCDPPPEGLGFPRPGMVPNHYMKNPDQWALDMNRVLRLKREQQLREGNADRTVSTGMAPGTRQLLEDIRRLAREGNTAADISARLDVAEAGVRNVLALGQGAEDAGALGPGSAARDRGVPKELGKVLAGRARKWEWTPETAECCLRSRSLAHRTGDAVSSATPGHSPCTR